MLRDGIVVGTDFSEEATGAIAYAARLARAVDADLLVTHSWNDSYWSTSLAAGDLPVEKLIEAARASSERALDTEVAALNAAGTKASAHFLVGPASRELPRFVLTKRAGLLVVGRRGSARLPHVRMGSVTERVARGSSVPVLVIPDLEVKLALPHRLMVGIDFSRASADALRAALGFEKELGCRDKTILVHAFQDERALWLSVASDTSVARPTPYDSSRVRKWLESQGVERAALEYRSEEGLAEVALPAAARREGCDWIVLGLQGRTALASFLIGSTTLRIVESTDRPVLVVPPSGPPERESVG